MRQWNLKGFTLIELLIVVAIIAILAAIAVPNFLEAQTRAKVSRAKNDMRSISTGLESYFVDKNTFVGCAWDEGGEGITVNGMLQPDLGTRSMDIATDPGPAGARFRITFATYNPLNENQLGHSLTTPIAYLTTIPNDPFADTKGSAFGYLNAMDAGFILWSYGPDTDEMSGTVPNGQLQAHFWKNGFTTEGNFQGGDENSVYDPYRSNPTVELLTGSFIENQPFTYDSTNGTSSPGDVWRVKD